MIKSKSEVRQTKLKFLDIETYPNVFLTCFKDKDGTRKAFLLFNDQIIEGENYLTREEFLKAVNSNIIATWNGRHYDGILLQFVYSELKNRRILSNQKIYSISSAIISKDKREMPRWINKYKYNQAFRGLDLMEVLRKGYNVKTLKLVAVNLLHDKIEELIAVAGTHEATAIKKKLQEIVPEYTPQL